MITAAETILNWLDFLVIGLIVLLVVVLTGRFTR